MQSTSTDLDLDKDTAAKILDEVRSLHRQFVLEPEAKQILRSYGIATPQGRFCRTLDEAQAAAREIGYPVVLKVVSPKVIHKTEMGGVRVNIASESALRDAYEGILESVSAHVSPVDIHGVLVEEMVHGHEIIIGASRDPQFGPVVMFGLGGIFVEVLKDVSYRLAPLDKTEALEMVREIKGYPLLAGARGGRPVNESSLADVLVRVSMLVDHFPEIKELDLNPAFADGDRIVAADARIIID